MRVAIPLLIMLATSAHAGTIEDAWADNQKLPLELQRHVRYFDIGSIPEKELRAFLNAFLFWTNSVSRDAEFFKPFVASPTLLRLDIRDPGWSVELWEKLAAKDPYFHMPVTELKEVEEVYNHKGGDYQHPDGRLLKDLKPGPYTIVYKKQSVVTGPWLPAKEMAALILATGSQVPVVRADWFVVQISRQLDRQEQTGAGYYDFLGIKSRNDILKLTGLDEAVARRIQREIAAIVEDSGVAINSRGIIRKGAQAGGAWITLDTAGNRGEKNALRVLNGDFKHQAEEWYFVLPNELFGLAAVNAADGTLQDSVPPQFATDKVSTDNDGRVHPGNSCVRCHVEGLRPIKDWAREFYRDDILLQSPDYEKFKRLRALYLKPLEDKYEADQLVYAKALHRLTGLTPQQMAKTSADVWYNYVDRKVTGEQLARELGTTRERMVEAFARSALANSNQVDPIIGKYLKKPEQPARRDQIEEAWPLFQAAIGGHR